MKIKSELILILSMVVLLATSGILSQTPVAFVFAEDGDGGDGGGDKGGDSGGGGGDKGDSGGDSGGDKGGDSGGGNKDDGDSGGGQHEEKQQSQSQDSKDVNAPNKDVKTETVASFTGKDEYNGNNNKDEESTPKYHVARDESGKPNVKINPLRKFVKDDNGEEQTKINKIDKEADPVLGSIKKEEKQQQEESTPKHVKDENGERILKIKESDPHAIPIKDDNDEGDKQGTSEGGKESNDAPQEENDGAVSEEPKEETKNPEDLKGTPEEQEKAAVEDYIHEEPGIVKPYPYVPKDKPVTKEPWNTGKSIPKINLRCSHLPEGCDDDKWQGKGDGKGGWCKQHPGKCGDGDGGKKHWCDWHDCHDDHHKHNHNHDNHHYDSNTKNYYYYYTNDYNNNHATVILQPDYSHSNNYHDIRVVIGDEYAFDTVVDFSGKPENLVVTGLDINAGEAFDVCMKNQNDGGQTNCVTAHLQDEDKAVYVDIRVP